MAKRLRVSERTLRHWEKDTTAPAIRFVPRIITFLEYDLYPEPMNPSQRLFASRRRQGLAIRELAGQLGIDPETLRRWERGFRVPRGRWLELVEEFLRGS